MRIFCADDQRDRVAQRCVRLDGQQRAEISSRMIAMSLRTPTDSGYAARLRKNAR